MFVSGMRKSAGILLGVHNSNTTNKQDSSMHHWAWTGWLPEDEIADSLPAVGTGPDSIERYVQLWSTEGLGNAAAA
jgi:hypothetical protein